MNTTLDSTMLQSWLEWAGGRLIAMPGRRVGPADPGVAWPEYSQNRHEVLNFRSGQALRAMGPNSDEIPIMDEILLLPNLCSRELRRRVLHARSIVHPINGRYLYNWERIAKKLDVKAYTVRSEHKRGLDEVVSKASPIIVCRISSFMQTRSL